MEYFYDNVGVMGFIYNGEQYVYRKDLQGDIIAVLDNTGTVVVQYVYDAWGESLVLDGNGYEITNSSHIGQLNPFRYRGYFYDVETGLYYLKSRYYDPATGRFINIDSITYADPQIINGLNLYAYCYNNPLLYVDSYGKSPEIQTEVNLWSLYNFKNYVWQSGRYVPHRSYIYNNTPFKNLGNNMLFAGELFLNKFELNFAGYRFAALNLNSGVTVFSAGFDLLDGRFYFSDTDYLGTKIGSVNLDFLDIQPMENNYTIVDAQATLLNVGAYSEYVDAEFLVGSVGVTLKFENSKFSIGFSWGIGFKITIKLG